MPHRMPEYIYIRWNVSWWGSLEESSLRRKRLGHEVPKHIHAHLYIYINIYT